MDEKMREKGGIKRTVKKMKFGLSRLGFAREKNFSFA